MIKQQIHKFISINNYLVELFRFSLRKFGKQYLIVLVWYKLEGSCGCNKKVPGVPKPVEKKILAKY